MVTYHFTKPKIQAKSRILSKSKIALINNYVNFNPSPLYSVLHFSACGEKTQEIQ